MNYVDFAAKICFFEFIQKEFKEPHFITTEYKNEIDLLNQNINIDILTKLFETNPKIIDVFEETFQMLRFTNTQFIHFCFDVNILNNFDDGDILNYSEKSVLNFENGEKNLIFINLLVRNIDYNDLSNTEKIYYIKATIIKYIDKIQKNRDSLYYHLSNSIGTRYRLAKYLIENLKADDYFTAINLERLLKLKRHPIDTKRIHGNFGTIKITSILKQNNIVYINELIQDKILSNNVSLPEGYKNKFCYVTEKSINGIEKRKDRNLKVFDFIIIYNNKPIILIETNFYSTSGTKIGINQGEYTDLIRDIGKFNQKNNENYHFIWITDGNYWLSKDGNNRFMNLKTNYFKEDYELLNYNLFKIHLPILLSKFEK